MSDLVKIMAPVLLFGALAPVPADELDDHIRAQMQKHHIPGLSLAILRDGKVVFVKGYGLANIEWSIPATEDAVYPLASTTKVFTGTAIMILVEQGKLSLDDKVSQLLPGLPSSWSSVTVRHCLTHTSGLPDVLNVKPSASDRPDSRDEILHKLSALPLEFQPGEKAAYNQTGYLLLGLIIERASGKSFEEFVSERIFQPLKMTSSCFRYAGTKNSAGVRGYFSTVVKSRAGFYSWENNHWENFEWCYGETIPLTAAGLNSSVSDMAKFDKALSKERLLKKSSLDRMWAPMKLNNGEMSGYGLGWELRDYRGHKNVGHNGGGLSSNFIRFLDDRLTIILFSNLASWDPELADGVARLYLSVPQPSEDKDPKTP